ncbi:MAG: DUF2157 domain-containing protein [Bacteroidota bacterium]
MSKKITVDLGELQENGILTEETAAKIQAFYAVEGRSTSNRMTIAFSILGAMLVGLGIILIVGHNWDSFPRALKISFSFLPILIGQAACFYSLRNKRENASWREGSAVFLFLSIGACIAMISQIYNMEGSISSFLLSWLLLCLPIVYLMRSTLASLLFLVGITWYGADVSYGSNGVESWLFWLLYFSVFPFYYRLFREATFSNGFNVHSWVVAITFLIALGFLAVNLPVVMWLAYMSLLGIYFLLGAFFGFERQKLLNNPYRVLGALGTLGIFFFASFDDYWKDIFPAGFSPLNVFSNVEFYISILLFGLALYLLIGKGKWRDPMQLNPLSLGFIIYWMTFFIGGYSPLAAAILINILLLLSGLFYIRLGSHREHLGFLNLGLVIVTILIICRFFDADISFVLKGGLFVLLGLGFFFANYQLLKKRAA